jgi:hypothetical protein
MGTLQVAEVGLRRLPTEHPARVERVDGMAFDPDVAPGGAWRARGLSLRGCARVRSHLPGIPGARPR